MSNPALEQLAPVAARLVSVDGKTYPLEAVSLLARAQGGIAFSTLVQSFANPHDEPLEVVYTMPLPADGAVLGYTITIGERVIRGEVQPHEQAAAAYKQALYEGRTAGLLEQQRADTFEQKLGNVPPHTKVQVSIDVLHPLAFLTQGLPASHATADLPAAPEWEYRFPTVVGVRYHGAPGRVPDQESLSPDRGATGEIPTRVGLTLDIEDGPRGLAWSPSHRIDFSPTGAVIFPNDEALDRDVVVRWAASTDEVGVHLVEGRGLAGDDGRYALVTLVPPARPAAAYRRDLTVLLDSSGSMSGLPLDLAKVVVGDVLRSLQRGDRFELLAFSNSVTRLTRGLTRADERSLADALAALRSVQAGGGTEMASAITEALKPTDDDAQRQVVLVTDGGVSFEHEVIGRITAERNVRLHVVGVGHVPNRTLTQQAAAAGRGLELLATTHADAAAAARRLIAGTASPVLTQVAITGTALTGVVPTQLRDVFAGQPLMFAVELSSAGGSVELSGSLAGAGAAWTRQVTVPPVDAADGLDRTALPVGALCGRERVARIELDRAGSGYRHFVPDYQERVVALDAEIERVAMRHRIVSRRTSLVAIAEEPSVDPLAPRRRERLAVEVPAGVSAEGVGLGLRDSMMVADAGPSIRGLHMIDAASAMPGQLPEELLASRLQDALRQSFDLFRGSDAAETAPSSRVEREAREHDAKEKAAQWAEFVWRREHEDPEVTRREILDAWYRSVHEEVVVTRVAWIETDVVLVDVVIPFPGPNVPERAVKLEFHSANGDRTEVEAELVFESCKLLAEDRTSSRIRLALRMSAGTVWPATQPVQVTWMSRVRDPFGEVHQVPARFHFQVPRDVSSDSEPGSSGGR